MGYVSAAQRKAVWASKKDGGKGNPNKKSPAKMSKKGLQKISKELKGAVKMHGKQAEAIDKYISKSPFKMTGKSPLLGKISDSCKARAKRKFKVWPSAYASGWGVRCTQGKL